MAYSYVNGNVNNLKETGTKKSRRCCNHIFVHLLLKIETSHSTALPGKCQNKRQNKNCLHDKFFSLVGILLQTQVKVSTTPYQYKLALFDHG